MGRRLDDFIEVLKKLTFTSDQEQFAVNLTYEAAKEIIADKRLEAFEIIKNKNVDVRALKYAKTYKEYNARILDLNPTITSSIDLLTEQEFKLLKEALQC